MAAQRIRRRQNRDGARRPADRRPTADNRGGPAASRWGADPNPERNAAPPEHEQPSAPARPQTGARRRPNRAAPGAFDMGGSPPGPPTSGALRSGEDLRAPDMEKPPKREKARRRRQALRAFFSCDPRLVQPRFARHVLYCRRSGRPLLPAAKRLAPSCDRRSSAHARQYTYPDRSSQDGYSLPARPRRSLRPLPRQAAHPGFPLAKPHPGP